MNRRNKPTPTAEMADRESRHFSKSITALSCRVSIDRGGLRKVTGSHVCCKNGNILEMMQDKGGVTRDHQSEGIYGLSNSAIFNQSINYLFAKVHE